MNQITAIYKPKDSSKIPTTLERFVGKKFDFVYAFSLYGYGSSRLKAYECTDINWPSYVVYEDDLEIIENE